VRDDPVLAFQTGEKSGVATFFSNDSRTRISVFHADPENFQIVAYVPEDGWVEQFTTSGSSTIKDVPVERALHDFSEFHPSIRQLFTTATTRDVVRIRDLDLLPEWHSGKAILIGDAAHAVTPRAHISLSRVFMHIFRSDFGAGSNAAIEDAEALGYFLRDLASAEQISAALKSFKVIRMPRAHTIQFASRQVGGRLSEEERNKAGP
jgi:salicylate hydroxylase